MYGIIGFPLKHSWSPRYFKEKFQQLKLSLTYTAFPLQSIAEFPALIQNMPELAGLNVTHPFKRSVIPYLDRLSNTAARVKAVNCIAISSQGVLTGHNTDVTGFRGSLLPLLLPQHRSALILGSGGAAKAVGHVLSELGIQWHIVSRKKNAGNWNYGELSPEVIRKHLLIINASPVGMYPHQDSAPEIPYQGLSANHLLYDLVYNPSCTLFLKNGQKYGAVVKNGYEMLRLQAEASWEIWKRS